MHEFEFVLLEEGILRKPRLLVPYAPRGVYRIGNHWLAKMEEGELYRYYFPKLLLAVVVLQMTVAVLLLWPR